MRGLFGLGKKKQNAEQKPEVNEAASINPASETKYIVHYNRKTCIGAGVCAAVDGKHWDMSTDGKARLKDSAEKSENIFEREITEAELEEVRRAAEGCPPTAIQITKKGTGEKII